MGDINLVEMTLADLFISTQGFHRGKMIAALGIPILEVKYVILPEKSLLVKATIAGSEEDSYTTIIKFLNVSLRGKTEIETEHGVKKISQIKPRSKDVEVFCNCKSFYWSFNRQNAGVNALYDKERNYRKEEAIGSPRGISPNPAGVPGICKHLIALSRYLETNNIINKI